MALPHLWLCNQYIELSRCLCRYVRCYMRNWITGRRLYFVADPPHLIKKLRNAAISSHRTLHVGEHKVKQQHYIDLLAADLENPYLSVTQKLTEAHVKPNNWEKMNVPKATQLLSRSVGDALRYQVEVCKEIDKSGTMEFTYICNELFDLLNSEDFLTPAHLQPSSEAGSQTPFQKLERVCGWFDQQAAAADGRTQRPPQGQGLSPAEAEKTWLASQTRFDLCLAIHAFSAFCQDFLTYYRHENARLIPRRLNQDALENLFGQIRLLGRANTNPTVLQYAQHIQRLIITAQHNTVRKGNTESDRRKQQVRFDAGVISPWTSTVTYRQP